MLHWDSQQSTYEEYFDHVRRTMRNQVRETKAVKDWKRCGMKIDSIEIATSEKVLISSDQEKSLVNAVETVWPKATLIFCTRHLEDNLNRFLTGKNVPKDMINLVKNAFFAEKTGLVFSEASDFPVRKAQLINDIGQLYFEHRYLKEFCDRIEKNVCAPRWAFNYLSPKHENNMAETMNSVVKRTALFETKKVPYAMQIFINLFVVQDNLAQLALQGQGKVGVRKEVKHVNVVTPAYWNKTKPENQESLVIKLFRGPVLQPRLLISANGETEMDYEPRVSRKPGGKNKRRNPTTPIPKRKREPKKKANHDVSESEPEDTSLMQHAASGLNDADDESDADYDAANRKRTKKQRFSPKKPYQLEGLDDDADDEATQPTKQQPQIPSSAQEPEETIEDPLIPDSFMPPNQPEKRALRPRKQPESEDEFDVDEWLEKEMKEKREKDSRKAYFDRLSGSEDDEDPLKTPKLPKRQTTKPKYLEEYYMSEQRANKRKKGKKTPIISDSEDEDWGKDFF